MALQSVCVYCGSSNRVDDKYKKTAEMVGQALAERKIRVIYGGGHVGMMGLLADAALQAGGEVVGIIPDHICAHEIQHPGLTDLIVVDSMHTRKRMMEEKSDAFVILPGGFGTLDEAFETLTLKQLCQHNKPVVIFNVDNYWTPLVELIDHMINSHFAPADNRQIYTTVTNLPDMLTALDAPLPPPCHIDEKWA